MEQPTVYSYQNLSNCIEASSFDFSSTEYSEVVEIDDSDADELLLVCLFL